MLRKFILFTLRQQPFKVIVLGSVSNARAIVSDGRVLYPEGRTPEKERRLQARRYKVSICRMRARLNYYVQKSSSVI